MNLYPYLVCVTLVSQLGALGAEKISVATVFESNEDSSAKNPESIHRSVDLNSVLEVVREFNPSLKGARFLIAEARARYDQSGRLPNPQLITQGNQNVASEEFNTRIGLMQSFPITGRLRQAKAVTLAEWRAAEAEVRNVERLLTREASQLLIQILASRESIRIRQRQLELAESLTSFISVLQGRGESSAIEVTQSRLEADRINIEISQLEIESRQLESRLKPFLGMNPRDVLKVSGNLEAPELPVQQEVDLNLRPDYVTAELALRSAAESIELERAKRWEDISAGLFTNYSRFEDQPTGLRSERMIGLQLSIPLPIWNRNQGAIQASRDKRLRRSHSLEALALDIKNEVNAAWQSMSMRASLIHQIKSQMINESSKQVDATLTAYQNGLIDLLSVLKTQDQLLQIQTAYINVLRDFHIAKVNYKSAIGTLTERETP